MSKQLFNNWGNGGFNGSNDTPISALGQAHQHAVKGTAAQAAWDIWTSSGAGPHHRRYAAAAEPGRWAPAPSAAYP